MKKIAYEEMYENEMTHPWYLATRRLMLVLLKKHLSKNSFILDAGCGTGGTMKFLKERGYKNLSGIDNSEIAIRYCRKRGLKGLKRGTIQKLPYKDNCFDAVLCMDVLYHKGVEPLKALREFKRVLKKGGHLYLQEPTYNWLKSRHDKVVETSHRFTKKEINDLARNAGFKVVKSSHFNTFFLPVLIVKRLTEKFISNSKKSDVSTLPFLMNSLMLIILNFEAYLIRHTSLPFGLSIIMVAQKK